MFFVPDVGTLVERDDVADVTLEELLDRVRVRLHGLGEKNSRPVSAPIPRARP